MRSARRGWKAKHSWAVGLALGSAALTLASCGGGNSSSGGGVVQNGALFALMGDAPVGNILSLRVNVSELDLRVQGRTQLVTVFPTSTNVTSLMKVNLTSLRDSSTILNLSSIPAVTYDQAILSLTSAELVVYDPSQNPPIRTLPVTLSGHAPVMPLSPPLVIQANKVSALLMDFDMVRSLAVDAQGQVTGKLNPVAAGAAIVPTDPDGFGYFDDLVGFVRQVTPYPGTQNFTGAFSLQLLSGTGPSLSVNLDPNTQLDGIANLNLMTTGSVVEVGAYIDSGGNMVARTVQVEDRAEVENKQLAFLGTVLSVAKDANGNVRSFSFFLREEEPDISTTVPLDSVVVVNVGSATTFHLSSPPVNFANLQFDGASIAPGQELIVHGQYAVITGQPATVAANSIYLRIQTLQGTLQGSPVLTASDGRSGAFWLTPALSLLQSTPVLVVTDADTVYLNLAGLGQITTQANLLARGLAFYQVQAATINGVPVPAGTLVLLTRQLHRLS
ncbi:MAG: DUF4382 domain-containing protein [Acidobacteriia bacterium]|nr:DUF4382 domain-containing protein [Terriglobia bacterium]